MRSDNEIILQVGSRKGYVKGFQHRRILKQSRYTNDKTIDFKYANDKPWLPDAGFGAGKVHMRVD